MQQKLTIFVLWIFASELIIELLLCGSYQLMLQTSDNILLADVLTLKTSKNY